MAIECLVLGAGQEVGKSCVVVTINGKRIMFDCGMHMGYLDHRRFPDFSLISESGDFNTAIDCIVITHFHLDHVGALPYFTEVCGYSGPIYMTYPTKALSPLMLEDYRKVMVDRRGEEELFSYDDIMKCMKKVLPVDLKQTVQVDEDLQIRAYYAGHVLGAAMFYAKVGDATMVYTGDYNMTPDRHLGAAQIDQLQLDLLITESTYATTIRDSKYAREREFLKAVHKCVAGGGKVLIPTFALGRAQELCILLDNYWERLNLKVPIYFSAGLTIQANMYYKMLISWTNQRVKETFVTHNAFDFKNVQRFDRSLINAPGPCVLFATPGMISGGFSLEVFKHWAPSEMNLVTLPGYCLAGTIGHKLSTGKPATIDLDKDTQISVRCKIHQLSFSPHTDAKGIMDLVKFLSPKHVILVHGEKPKMASLKGRIESDLGIQCYHPANNEMVSIPSTCWLKADASKAFIQSSLNPNFKFARNISEDKSDTVAKETKANSMLQVHDERVTEGILIVEKSKKAKVVHQNELLLMLGKDKHDVQFAYCCPVQIGNLERAEGMDFALPKDMVSTSYESSWLHLLLAKLSKKIGGNIQDFVRFHILGPAGVKHDPKCALQNDSFSITRWVSGFKRKPYGTSICLSPNLHGHVALFRSDISLLFFFIPFLLNNGSLRKVLFYILFASNGFICMPKKDLPIEKSSRDVKPVLVAEGSHPRACLEKCPYLRIARMPENMKDPCNSAPDSDQLQPSGSSVLCF